MAVPARFHGGGGYAFPMQSTNYDGGLVEYSMETVICAVFYVAIIVIFMMVIALIVKLLQNINLRDDIEAITTEQTGLLPAKEEPAYTWYGGTSSDEDLESGKINTYTTSSTEDLYDGKICVICYDDQRSCFFTPCGHCIACHTCADRIVSEENKSCPICRTYISNVMKLHLL